MISRKRTAYSIIITCGLLWPAALIDWPAIQFHNIDAAELLFWLLSYVLYVVGYLAGVGLLSAYASERTLNCARPTMSFTFTLRTLFVIVTGVCVILGINAVVRWPISLGETLVVAYYFGLLFFGWQRYERSAVETLNSESSARDRVVDFLGALALAVLLIAFADAVDGIIHGKWTHREWHQESFPRTWSWLLAATVGVAIHLGAIAGKQKREAKIRYWQIVGGALAGMMCAALAIVVPMHLYCAEYSCVYWTLWNSGTALIVGVPVVLWIFAILLRGVSQEYLPANK